MCLASLQSPLHKCSAEHTSKTVTGSAQLRCVNGDKGCKWPNLQCIHFPHCEINWLPNIAHSCSSWRAEELPVFCYLVPTWLGSMVNKGLFV